MLMNSTSLLTPDKSTSYMYNDTCTCMMCHGNSYTQTICHTSFMSTIC